MSADIKLASVLTQGVYDHWCALKGDRAMPLRSSMNPQAIDPLFLPNLIVMGVHHDPLDFEYRLMGTKVRDYMNNDYTRQRLSMIEHQRQGTRVWSALQKVVETKEPVSSRAPYVGPHKKFTTIEDILMPLTIDGSRVDQILVAIDFMQKRK